MQDIQDSEKESSPSYSFIYRKRAVITPTKTLWYEMQDNRHKVIRYAR